MPSRRAPGSITAERLWKGFPTDRRRKLLRDELERLRARRRGAGGKWRWALRDVSLDVSPGESVGIVGVNGSGKSTLLKVLTRVMNPNAGRLEVLGRVAALIDVRAGIHPDLTGRENIFLYGSLLGLPRAEVARHFEAIVDFAEIGAAIDRQVKHYSTGMQMRLGFAVAAFMDPNTLLVDEVLAVGDAAFQQKCLDKMRRLLAAGTTLVFVSHDLAAVEATCAAGLWLHNGVVQAGGPVRDVLTAYRRAIEQAAQAMTPVDGVVRLRQAEVMGEDGAEIQTQAPLRIRLVIESEQARAAAVYLGVSEGPATSVFVVSRELHLAAGRTEVTCTCPYLPLPRGRYYLWVGVVDGRRQDLLPWHPACPFDVAGPDLDGVPPAIVRLAPIFIATGWRVSHNVGRGIPVDPEPEHVVRAARGGGP